MKKEPIIWLIIFEKTSSLLNSNIDKSAANLEEIYILRVNQIVDNKLRGIAYKLDLKSPTSLMLADNFYLLNKDIKVMDATAISLAKDRSLPIIIFSIFNYTNILFKNY